MKVRVETLHANQYKLRMMGIPIYNMSVIYKLSKPELTLKKKCNAIIYHAIGKSVAMRKLFMGHIISEKNPADLLTKVVTGQSRNYLVSLVLHDIVMEMPDNG